MECQQSLIASKLALHHLRALLPKYQEDLTEWNLKRNGAISAAEGLINGINEQFSNTFKVNVNQHLGIFGIFIFAIFALTLAVQKAKDFF